MPRAPGRAGKAPYYAVRNGRAYWEPRGNVPTGFEPRPLGADGPEARGRAMALYAEMTAARLTSKPPALAATGRRGCIYFLVTADFIKIGFSTDPMGRISALRTGLPQGAVAFVTMAGSRDLEARLHAHFKSARSEGEWFRKTPRLLDAVRKAATGDLTGEGDL